MSDRSGVAAYYNQQVGIAKATGAGMVWFMSRDYLSPLLSNADEFALDSRRWREAGAARVLDLARRMRIKPGDHVLDLGCGIGGPARDVAEATGATVFGLSISVQQLHNLLRLSAERGQWGVFPVGADMQRLPFGADSLDGVFSINAVYHAQDVRRVVAEAYRVLRRGARFGFDDWFTTDRTTLEELATLRYNWSTGTLGRAEFGFHSVRSCMIALWEAGFEIVDVADFTTEAGAFLTEERFGMVYDDQMAPQLLEAFPLLYASDTYTPEPGHAAQAVAQLRSDILYMGVLYRSGHAVYRQFVAQK